MNRPSLPACFRRSAMAAAVSTLCLIPALSGQAAEPGPADAEFRVNTLIASQQQDPAVAVDADGDAVVVWSGFVAASNSYQIRAQRYLASGAPAGNEFIVNAVTTLDGTAPVVAMDVDGDIVVAWRSFVSGGSEIRARRVSAAGVPQGADIAVNATTTDTQRDPAVAIDADGDFVVAWESFVAGGASYEIRAQRFSALGATQGVEIAVNTVTTGSQEGAAVAMDLDGNFVLAWSSAADFVNLDIRAQRFNAAGVKQGGEIPINALADNRQLKPAVAITADGGFAVAWESEHDEVGNSEIHAAYFDANGVSLNGGDRQVNLTQVLGNQTDPAIASAADGSFAITWQSPTANHGIEIRGQRVSSDFETVQEFAVNTVSAGDQAVPGIGMDADGDFLIAWESNATGNADIRARRFQGPGMIDLSLFQTDSADPAPVGSPLSYTLSAGNLEVPAPPTGIAAIDSAIRTATGLRVVDVLPAGSTGVSASGTGWTCTLPVGRVVCDYGLTLPPGEEANPITVTLTPPNSPGALISNVGRLSAHQLDDNALNNRDVERTRLACAESKIEFTGTLFGAGESLSPAQIMVRRTGGTCGVARVTVDTRSEGDATPGIDYADTVQVLQWADGDSSTKTFSVPIRGDHLYETGETFRVDLSSISGASYGVPTTALVQILDDDEAPRVNWTVRTLSVPEEAGLVSVTAQLSEISGLPQRYDLVFSPAGTTATRGLDFASGANDSITIPAGQLTATKTLDIFEDHLVEGNETIQINLGQGGPVGVNSVVVITIVDDDAPPPPTVSFTTAASSGDETITRTAAIQLSAASAQAITVNVGVSGTATQGADYSLSRSSPITFNPGVTQIGIQTIPVNDSSDEPDETVVLTLSGATNATLGATTAHTRTIVDNDP